ncbi:hypothetical protein PCANC_19638 [Puccinia coronata f. sp. avenae]|uniref:Uncharacterized protein n=1 Tax=Puccinia coronata f. sp. avenae TaxID=200324 RepID=A0A2N5UHZ3_9BASI|nr:hypothetical protein PCANC_19638 [Puccinia coronata f. sp. avenae]
MNTPQQTPQQPQPPATERATPPVLPAPREEVDVEETPSEASLDLGEVRASPFAIGDAIGVVNAAERGLQLMYCVSRPDLPGGGLNEFQHPHLHQYRVGNKLLGPPVDVLYDAIEMAYGWRSFETFASNHFSTLNPGAANQIQANRRTPALTWQGIIPHHPWYDRRANAMIQGKASWRQFVVAIADAAQHGQNSQLWCVSHEPVLEHDAVVAALARHPRRPSADVMILVPAVPVVHLGNGQTPLPNIMVMVPSPTVQRELSVQIICQGTITAKPIVSDGNIRGYIGRFEPMLHRNGRHKIVSRRFWIGTRKIPSVWLDATSALVDTTQVLLDTNPVLVNTSLVSVNAIPAILDAILVRALNAISFIAPNAIPFPTIMLPTAGFLVLLLMLLCTPHHSKNA